jgi:hypothetical protein
VQNILDTELEQDDFLPEALRVKEFVIYIEDIEANQNFLTRHLEIIDLGSKRVRQGGNKNKFQRMNSQAFSEEGYGNSNTEINASIEDLEDSKETEKVKRKPLCIHLNARIRDLTKCDVALGMTCVLVVFTAAILLYYWY